MSVALKQSMTLDLSKVERDSADLEYEIKLECLDKKKSLHDLLNMVENVLAASSRYTVDYVQTVTKMVSHFLTDAHNEYSVFRYNDEVMLKIKRHDILKGHEFPVFKNNETFEYDLGAITEKLRDERILYVGNMLKRRIKDFIIDETDDRVYSLAITLCETGSQSQFQLEVEYYGHIRNSKKPRNDNESELLERLLSLCSFIHTVCPQQFAASVERKYEFVVKHGSVKQGDADQKKAHLLKSLEDI